MPTCWCASSSSSGGKLPTKQFELLEQAVESLIDREHGKLVFDWDVFMGEESFHAPQRFASRDSTSNGSARAAERERLETAAVEHRPHSSCASCSRRSPTSFAWKWRGPPKFGGLSVQELIELGSLYTDAALSQ